MSWDESGFLDELKADRDGKFYEDHELSYGFHKWDRDHGYPESFFDQIGVPIDSLIPKVDIKL